MWTLFGASTGLVSKSVYDVKLAFHEPLTVVEKVRTKDFDIYSDTVRRNDHGALTSGILR